jgi:hypothetical protein
MGAMSGNPQECREHAKDCLELASEAPPSSLARARFEELAKTWIHLATDLEHANSLLKRWGDAKLAKTG